MEQLRIPGIHRAAEIGIELVGGEQNRKQREIWIWALMFVRSRKITIDAVDAMVNSYRQCDFVLYSIPLNETSAPPETTHDAPI